MEAEDGVTLDGCPGIRAGSPPDGLEEGWVLVDPSQEQIARAWLAERFLVREYFYSEHDQGTWIRLRPYDGI